MESRSSQRIEPKYLLPKDEEVSNPLENTVALDLYESRERRALTKLERLIGYRFADYASSCGFVSERYVDIVHGDSSVVVITCSKTNGCFYDYAVNHNRRVEKEIADKKALYESAGKEVSVAHDVFNVPKEIRHLITVDNFDGFLEAMARAVSRCINPNSKYSELDIVPTLHYFGSGKVIGY